MDNLNILCFGLLSGYLFIMKILRFFKNREEEKTDLVLSKLKQFETFMEQKLEYTKSTFNSNIENIKKSIFDILEISESSPYDFKGTQEMIKNIRSNAIRSKIPLTPNSSCNKN
jgi:hypothetical protein